MMCVCGAKMKLNHEEGIYYCPNNECQAQVSNGFDSMFKAQDIREF
jgi:hypothetical protein